MHDTIGTEQNVTL